MNNEIKQKIVRICDEKILKKWDNVWLSFYAFFENKNTNPELLLEVAKWWIMEHKLDHFVKAKKIKQIILDNK